MKKTQTFFSTYRKTTVVVFEKFSNPEHSNDRNFLVYKKRTFFELNIIDTRPPATSSKTTHPLTQKQKIFSTDFVETHKLIQYSSDRAAYLTCTTCNKKYIGISEIFERYR
jgi:hypothetical protein